MKSYPLSKISDANPAKRFAAEEVPGHIISVRNPAKRFMTEQGAGVRKRMLSAYRKQELEEQQRRGWDGGIRTHDIRVKVWCVTITLHPNIGAKIIGDRDHSQSPISWGG